MEIFTSIKLDIKWSSSQVLISHGFPLEFQKISQQCLKLCSDLSGFWSLKKWDSLTVSFVSHSYFSRIIIIFFIFFIGLKKYDTTKRYLLCLICFSKTVMWYRDQTSVFLYLNPKKCLVISHALPVEFEKKSETNLNISWDTWVRLRTLLSYKRETSEK